MAELSSNWKKLQEKIKAESSTSTSTSSKRKASDSSQPLTKNKRVKTAPKKTPTTQVTKAASGTKAASSSGRRMGAVQSSIPTERAKTSTSPSHSLWTKDKEVSAEHLAEAYNLGVRSPGSTAGEGFADKVNQGLSSGMKIGKYIAMDCEMVGVGPGGHESALARVSMVDFHGQQIYDTYVKPAERVTDWRTPVSGISPKEMRFAREFADVQREVHGLLKDRVLIGHDLKHDLEALQLSHAARDVRDTAKYHGFKRYGNGRKPALKVLAREILGWEIQDGAHSSTEDARAAMMLFRRHKPGFDVDHANRYAPLISGTRAKGKKKR